MELLENKQQFELDSRLQCRACLSIGRKLAPLAKYTNIYMKLTADVLHPILVTQPIEICWECQSLLRKVLLFQQQVKKAYELLLNNQNFIYGPLSNLASVTFNDKHHAVYLNECNLQEYTRSKKDSILLKDDLIEKETVKRSQINTIIENIIHKYNSKTIQLENSSNLKLNRYVISDDNKKCNVLKMDMSMRKGNDTNVTPLNDANYVPSDNNISSDTNKEIRNEHNKNKINVHHENVSDEDDYIKNDFNFGTPINNTCIVKKQSKPKKQKSRWATIRAAQNKKPKYKIVSTNIGEVFTKVQISDDELAELLAIERDGEYYKSKRFKCDTCVLGFVEEKELLRHTEKHSNKISAFICDICNAKIDDKSHLSGHIAKHYIVYKCKICLFICRNEETRIWHFQSEHNKVLRCLKCGLKFSNRRDFFNHHKDWHEKYVCDHCGVSFKMRYCIKEHIRKQHSPFTCVPCNKTFARYNGLWLHNKLAHSPPAPPAYCVECDTTYKDIYRYKWHLCNSAKHSPKKKNSFPCPGCKKTFTKNIYMKDHYNLVHLKKIRYRCEQCDKNFIRNAELVKHRRRKHEGILPPKNKICYLCGRGFTTNKILRNHVRTHREITEKGNTKEKLI